MHEPPDAPNPDLASTLIETDPDLKRLRARIRRIQGKLRRQVTADVWRLYLQIDDIQLERLFTLADVVLEKANAGSTGEHTVAGRGPLDGIAPASDPWSHE